MLCSLHKLSTDRTPALQRPLAYLCVVVSSPVQYFGQSSLPSMVQLSVQGISGTLRTLLLLHGRV